MKNKYISLLAAGSLLVSASSAFAAPVNITIADFNQSAPNYFGGGPFGLGGEDNETEPGTINSQAWDMEAFVVVGKTLYIVGGYNMQAGAAGGGGSVVSGMLVPGDLFIKVGGSQPGANPIVNTPGTVSNSNYGYTYAIDLTLPIGATGAAANLYSLSNTSLLNSVVYDQFGANPWKYSSGGTFMNNNVGISYMTGLADNNAFLTGTLGLTGTPADGVNGQLRGGNHNVLAIDLSFLSVAAGTDVWFSYTMECGNDSLKGQFGGGFDKVPDGATSVVLIALGLISMAVFGSKRRKS
jgi:hypothetical protein